MDGDPVEIPIDKLVDALLKSELPLPARFIYRLSDISATDLEAVKDNWLTVPASRRQVIMDDIELLGENDYTLSFEAFAIYALGDPEAKVRRTAVRILAEYESEAALAALLALLEDEEVNEVRAATASALGTYVYLGETDMLAEHKLHQVEDTLFAIYRSEENAAVRRSALESLGYSSREEVEGLIEDAYHSEHEDWLISAISAMGRSANTAWKRHILSKLESDSPGVRTEATRAAGELELEGARSTIFELLDDDDEGVRTAAIWALSQIGGDGVRDRLEALYENTDDDEEAEYIEAALDNLSFTEDLDLFSLMDINDDDLKDDFFDFEDDDHEDQLN